MDKAKANNNNTNALADLFKNATTLSRTNTEPMADGFKVYASGKAIIKHPDLNKGDKVLVKMTKTQVVFIKDEQGNRTLSSKGTDGRLSLSLNKQMLKVFKDTPKNTTLELIKQTDEQGTAYYFMNANATAVED